MHKFPHHFDIPQGIIEALMDASENMLAGSQKAFRIARRGRRGDALKPGAQTALWNALVAEVKPHLKTHGEQARLARLLGLHRQAIHSYFTAETRMPDAERTLQLLAWLSAKKQGKPVA